MITFYTEARVHALESTNELNKKITKHNARNIHTREKRENFVWMCWFMTREKYLQFFKLKIILQHSCKT